ncbi:MAG: tRNA dihydrouridine synthase DusB [Oscillospiraceae bacterium]|nr:tRNA dihydrouridine synthase DusB [Oscillospiraceae bacterium]
MNFGTLQIPIGAALAPMAGATDAAMRSLSAEYGAAFTVSEMVSAKALTMQDRKSACLLRGGGGGAIYGVQLFGHEPEVMHKAVEIICAGQYAFDFIDINMGCPAPKITGSGAGSALLKTPALAGEIAAAAVSAAGAVPVTVKLRIGWDETILTGREVAMLCEKAGVSAIAVHARTRAEMYTPGVHLDAVKAIKDSVGVPVLVNGDIISAETALTALNETGADGLMIGRAAMGNPWLFREVAAAMRGQTVPPPPSLEERFTVLRRHIRAMCDEKGERVAMQEARSHAAWYMHGLNGAAALRRECCAMTEYMDLDTVIHLARSMNA